MPPCLRCGIGGLGLFFAGGDLGAKMGPDPVRHILVHRAGVSLLLGHTELRKNGDDHPVGLLAFPRQLVDSDFSHT
jgi:hypothetical protein